MTVDTLKPNNESRLRDLEHNVMLRFSLELKQRHRIDAEAGGVTRNHFAGTSLGAQDQVLADYLLAANARFALIEFKASASEIGTEKVKKLRQALWKKITAHDDMLRRCLDMHYICWGTLDTLTVPGIESVQFEEGQQICQYAPAVAKYMDPGPLLDAAEVYTTSEFLTDFLDSHLAGADASRFRKYVDELSVLAEGKKGSANTIEGMVCVFIPATMTTLARYAQVRFRGMRQLTLLLDLDGTGSRRKHAKGFDVGQDREKGFRM